jgi:2-dehydropantoate 2-reductase
MADRILIVGAGAVGGYAGAHMARAGHEVIFLDPWPAHVDAMNAQGLTIRGVTEEEGFTQAVRALHLTDAQALSKEKPIDIAFVCVKSYDTAWATELAMLSLAPDGFVVSLQNGINEDTMARVAGWGRTVGCIASKIVVELEKPGWIQRNVPKGGEKYTVFRVGEAHGRITPRAEKVRDLVATADSAKATSNLWGERWSKLVQNAMGNGVSAATGLSVKEYHREEVTRRLSIRLAGEAIRTGLAHGYALELINATEPEAWVAAAEQLERGANDAPELSDIEAKMLKAAEAMGDGARPSMGQDMLKGRRTEIEHLNGLVAARAAEAGLPAKANLGLVRAVQTVERGQAPASVDRVRDI